MKNQLLKIFALLFFASGLCGFVAYQSGYFFDETSKVYQGSHNGGAVTAKKGQVKTDSVKTAVATTKQDTVEAVPFMAGSKTMVIRKPKNKISDPPLQLVDTVKFTQRKPKKFKL
jgi:hypothetical protein